MTFHWRRALAVAWKDGLDLRKNPGLVWSMFALPAVLVVVPALVVWAWVRSPNEGQLRDIALFYDPAFVAGANATRFVVDRFVAIWFGLYLLMPLFTPILIASQSVAGEKERRTLEPLLASPVSSAELLAGKSLAAVIPAVGITWVAFLVFSIAIDAVAWPLVQTPLLPNAMWLFGVGVVAPLYAFLGNGIAVLVSARVGESRLAQQLSALVVLPLMGVVAGQLAGWLRAGASHYAIQGAVVLLLDVVLVAASVRLFDRERLVSRWS
ncbi:MAG TPA: ABC transporter permease subunit [Myxococcaceae bacterium]|jgi:ABC-type transport system involved in multi-copper enzyme maturation permease subunit|nr:ABC transporter permease subunit [Myxococcaceae bacterium]